MGRRFLLILAMMLLALSTAPAVRGQVTGPKAAPTEPVPAPDAPAPFPSDLAPPTDGTALDDPMPALKTNRSGATKDQAKKQGPAAARPNREQQRMERRTRKTSG